MAFEVTNAGWSWAPNLASQVVVEYKADQLVYDFIQSCEERIRRHFAEMGVTLFLPPDFYASAGAHYARRARSIWDL